jgi:outer membrane protein assembly factor BamB
VLPEKTKYWIITGAAAILFAAALIWWVTLDHYPADVIARVPGMDNRPKVIPRPDTVVIGAFFDSLGVMDEVIPGEWPRFRGSSFDNISSDSTPLAESFDTTGPQLVWKVTLGEGYSGPAVKNGRVYILDYNERRKADMLRCYSLKSGIELWRRWYYVELKRNHGYSRTIPSVSEKYVVTIGPRSHVMCCDPVSGEMLWSLDLEKEFGIRGTDKGRITPDFYTGQCPLIDGEEVILAPGGKALMIGVDCATGSINWKTPNPDSLRMSHGSIMPMILYGKKMYVYNAVGGVCGVSAEGEDKGKLLWTTTEWSPATTAASPLYLGKNEIAVFGSYGAGGARLKVDFNGTDYSASVVESHKATEGIASDQQTPIITGDLIWTVMPENAGLLKKQLVAYNIKDLKTPVWTSGKENRYGRGLGPFMVKGDRLFLLDDDANLYYFRLEGATASLISKSMIMNGIEAWAPMAMAGNYLILRDSRNMVCLITGKNKKNE